MFVEFVVFERGYWSLEEGGGRQASCWEGGGEKRGRKWSSPNILILGC